MTEEEIDGYEEMSEDEIFSFVEELREDVLDTIRKVKELGEEAEEDKRQIKEAEKRQDIKEEEIAQMYLNATERLKKGNDEMERINSEGSTKTKIRQLEDIYESTDSQKVKESALISLSAVNLELVGLQS